MYRAALLFVGCLLLPRADAAPSCAELNELWRSRFHADFKVRWDLGPFDCPSATAKTAKAFYDLGRAPTGHDYYRWASRLIGGTTYDLDKCTSYAYVSQGVMTLCRKFFSTNDEGRVGTIVHEAAHFRSDDPGHVACTRGRRTGEDGACDETLHEAFRGSGFNFEFVFYSALFESKYPELNKANVWYFLQDAVRNSFNVVTPAQVLRWGGSTNPDADAGADDVRCGPPPA